MTNPIEGTLRRLGEQLPGRVSLPGEARYAAATAIWAQPVGRMPRAVVHCRSAEDVQAAVRAARDAELPLSVRGGGHDWAGRALCDGLVIDLSGMRDVVVDADHRTARILGGARAADVAAATDPFGVGAVAGSVGAVGVAGLTLGGGYGLLIGRFGLALDNLLAAEIVLADGRIVAATQDTEPELFWALRGGGGNFGVVTAMHHRLHELPSVRYGALVYPFAEAKGVLERYVELAASIPDELTVPLLFMVGPDGTPLIMVIPAWSGPPEEGEAWIAPFRTLGMLLADTVEPMPYGRALSLFDPQIVNGRRTFMETCWLPALESASIDACIDAMATAASPGCQIITHEFKGAASRVPAEATAFGLRRDHVLVEILAAVIDPSDPLGAERHQQWARDTRRAFKAMALPGGYPNYLVAGEPERIAKSYGPNVDRLIEAKRRYDPDDVFRFAIPLPAQGDVRQTA
jgi:hypothetical protein